MADALKKPEEGLRHPSNKISKAQEKASFIHSLLHSVTHSFNNYTLNSYIMPATLLGTESCSSLAYWTVIRLL